MKNTLQEELKNAFEAPKPLHKKEFLKGLPQPKIGMLTFIFIQIGYIRKWVWVVSAFIFGVSLFGAVLLSKDMLWSIAAFTPLLALAAVSESGRSESYGMAELEMATRFSLRSVLLARLGILGMENLLLMGLLLPLGLWNHLSNPIQAGVYMLVPYLLTTWAGLWIIRQYKNREAVYFCGGIAACVSVSGIFCHMEFPLIYHENYFVWWCLAAVAFMVGIAKQSIGMIKQNELM
ncbi:MAG: hypothetical protein NC251_10570 [Lachnoclostridium sp.]|nr:hypothetical protein [Lachnospira sp.]MCM1248862.1 hypothetical protein [Lachnoclostridium sp.]